MAAPAGRTFRIGTRGSTLALIQARWVAEGLADVGISSEPVIVRTEGDDRPVDTAWGEGAFVGRIVEALLAGSVDMAVHSAKDVPTDEHPDLVIAAYPRREDPRDALVCRERGATLATLPQGARVGTDSPRRSAFLRARRPDLEVHPLHGNVDTRLAKLDRGETDALVLAVAGLVRLGRHDRIDEILPIEVVPTAPGQGALAVQVRADDDAARDAAARLDDPATRLAVVAERLLLHATGGGCRSPIGATGRLEGDRFQLVVGAERTWSRNMGGTPGGARIVWARGDGEPGQHRALAERLASRIVTLRARPRVLVARPAGQAGSLLDALEREGVEAVHVPAIEVRHDGPGGPLDRALARVHDGTWIVVTSANAASAALAALSRTRREPASLRWAAVGPTTASPLRQAGMDDIFLPTTSAGRYLADELPLGVGDRVLLPRGDAADGTLPGRLRARGVHVDEVPAYRTIEAPTASRELLSRAIHDGPIDAILVTSGSTARGILALTTEPMAAMLRQTPVVAAGEPSAEVARGLGFQHVLVSPTPGARALASCTADALRSSGSGAVSSGSV